MSDPPRRRLLDLFKGPPTVIGEGARLVGDLINPGSVVLCGAVHGDGDIGGSLSIARSAEWIGHVHARSAAISGRVVGNLTIAEKLEIGSTAVIKGDVTADTVAVARGAVIDGEINVTGSKPVVQFEEKRKARAETPAG